VRIPLSPPLIRQLSVVYPKERMHSRLVNDFVRFATRSLHSTDSEAALPAGRPAVSAK
jgi:hypothetical protein